MAQSKDNRDQQQDKTGSQGSIQQRPEPGDRNSQMNQQGGRADQGSRSNPSDIEDEDMDEDLPSSGQRSKQDNQNRKG